MSTIYAFLVKHWPCAEGLHLRFWSKLYNGHSRVQEKSVRVRISNVTRLYYGIGEKKTRSVYKSPKMEFYIPE